MERAARAGRPGVATRRRAAVDALEREARGLYPALAGAGAVHLQYWEGLGPEAGEAEFLAALEARFPRRPAGARRWSARTATTC